MENTFVWANRVDSLLIARYSNRSSKDTVTGDCEMTSKKVLKRGSSRMKEKGLKQFCVWLTPGEQAQISEACKLKNWTCTELIRHAVRETCNAIRMYAE